MRDGSHVSSLFVYASEMSAPSKMNKRIVPIKVDFTLHRCCLNTYKVDEMGSFLILRRVLIVIIIVRSIINRLYNRSAIQLL